MAFGEETEQLLLENILPTQRCPLKKTNLLLLEYICVFAQTKLAEEFRQIRSLKQAVEATAIASCQRGNAVHVVTATEIVFSCKGTNAHFRHITESGFPPTLYSARSLHLQST